ncbi:MAG: adenylosuccinate synthase [Planctomycetaceae bacterium]|nr:adenylosuccinate synthase [Planctomycetaceae bacterium]
MSGTCVVGLQWGDEAKGKVVDILTEKNDVVVRYQGGANAGHTVVTKGKKYKLSLIPSGIFRPNVQCVIAGGVVIDPASMLNEIRMLRGEGVTVEKNLMISDRAHVIFPWHKEEDRILDHLAGKESIGTTMRGIGPCYRDKVGRSLAVRLGDMYRPNFKNRLSEIADAKSGFLSQVESGEDYEELSNEEIYRMYADYAEQLRPFTADTTSYLLDAAESGKRLLFEGAQGSLLDIDHGTFPYVTSSNSSGVGVSAGSGVPACHITKVIGILKAYTTRVGGGPFPTEQDNETGQKIRERGNEYGTVTKRPRRCGWFDAVAVRYASRLGGVHVLSLMLLDVLSTFDEIRICTAYEINGKQTTNFPSHVDDLRQVKPVYESHPGWQEDITNVRTFDALPQNTKNYVKRIAEIVGRPIGLISVGPDREQTINIDL